MTPLPLTPEESKQLGSLQITEAALKQLQSDIHPVSVDQVLPFIAGSVLGLTGSVYFRRSQWFRSQPRHTIEVCSVKMAEPLPIKDGVPDANRQVVEREVRPVLVYAGGTLATQAEMPLPEDYFEQRLLEETRVDYF